MSIANAARGLSSAAAAARLRADGPNELPSARPRTIGSVAVDVVREPMLLLLIAVGAVYLLLGDIEEALAVLSAIGLVIGISIYEARKTEHALQALRDLSSPRAIVIRDGQTIRIAGRDVVRGDVILLREGDRVAADARVTAATNLATDESLLTGESVPVQKTVDPEATVYAGTVVIRGVGEALVTATATRTELGKIGAALVRLDTAPTALQLEVRRAVVLLATAGLVVCVVIAIAYGFHRGAWLGGVLAGLTAAIAMVPEEFPVVLTIFLALGAWRISRNRVLTRRMPAIEMLGAATVLCVDKTGTLTLNRMTVSAVVNDDVEVDLAADTREVPAACVPTIEAAILASRRDPFDPMERAFSELGTRVGVSVPGPDWTLIQEYPLSDRLLAVTQAWQVADTAGCRVATKGAPEAIARLCRLDAIATRAIADRVAALAGRGLRVLGVAACQYLPPTLPDSPIDFPFMWLGLVGLSDPVRPGVPAAVDECRGAGVRVVMITGDHAATAVAIARQIGLARDGDCLTGVEVSAMSDVELQRRLPRVDVFARMVPEQKLRLVTALKARGEIVAMTGDGVNDAPALKAAHIGIAMGERGTDVAREAASLVLLDDDFSSIVRAVQLGRRIYTNISKAMSYVLAVHVPVALASMVPVLAGGPMVLLPLHVILMELIIDPACSIAFEAEPAERDLMQRPPRIPGQRLFTARFIVRALAQGAGAGLAALAIYFGALRRGLGEFDVRTLTFATLIVSNLALILTSRSLRQSVFRTLPTPNRTLWILMLGAISVLALVLAVPVLRDVLRLAPAHADDALAIVAAGIVALAWMEAVKRWLRAPADTLQ